MFHNPIEPATATASPARPSGTARVSVFDQPRGESRWSPLQGGTAVDRHAGRASFTADFDEVAHLERCTRGSSERDMHGQHLVEPARLAVLDERLQHR